MASEFPAVDKIFKEEGVVCHSFSVDGSLCAVSLKKSHVIEIYRINERTFKNVNQWEYECSLTEHQQTVSCLSFSSQNLLLSVSHDKSIFVWERVAPGNWKKQQVACQNKLGFLTACWSPNGKKFAVGSSDNKVYLGYFETINNWWTTLTIPGFKASISTLAFHPSSKLLFIGSMDLSAKLLTVDIRGDYYALKKQKNNQADIDEIERLYKDKLEQEDPNYENLFTTFNNSYNDSEAKFPISQTGGWITAAAFSPNGQFLVFATHNSLLFTLTISQAEGNITPSLKNPIYLKSLPVKTLLFKDDKTLIAGMYSGQIQEFAVQGDTLDFVRNVQSGVDQSTSSVQKNAVGSRLAAWERRSQTPSNNEVSNSGHSTPVISLQKYTGVTAANGFTFSSNDINGNIFFWTF